MAEHSFRIRKAAELSGVTEDLIRAWERRYGILQPRRTPGGYRVYSDVDIAVLKRLRALVEEGMSIAEAARLVPVLRREVEQGRLPMGEAIGGAPREAWRVHALEAARSFDQQRMDAVLDQAFATLPPLMVVDSLLVPLMREVGTCWLEGQLSVAQEHLISQTVRMRLISLLHAAPRGMRKHVVCACMPMEHHEIGLLAAALRFRYAGMRVTILGQNTPAAELEDTVRRVTPDLVALACVMDPGSAQVEAVLRGLRSALPSGGGVVLGGLGAAAHAGLCRELDVGVHIGDADWEPLLG